MNIVGLIVARIGSVRLPRKNMLEVWGRPWIEWLIRQAVYTKQVNHTILVTDSHEMAAIAKKYDVEVMFQPTDYYGFGTVRGGGTACEFAREQLGDRIKDIDVFIHGIWSILMYPYDWDKAIDLYKAKDVYSVSCVVRAVRNDLMIDVGDNRYFRGQYIKGNRLLKRGMGAVASTEPEPIWSEDEREKECLYYELKGWQAHGNVDYQEDFDIAEFLFHKHILKGGECMTPYEDYYKDDRLVVGTLKNATAAFNQGQTI